MVGTENILCYNLQILFIWLHKEFLIVEKCKTRENVYHKIFTFDYWQDILYERKHVQSYDSSLSTGSCDEAGTYINKGWNVN